MIVLTKKYVICLTFLNVMIIFCRINKNLINNIIYYTSMYIDTTYILLYIDYSI